MPAVVCCRSIDYGYVASVLLTEIRSDGVCPMTTKERGDVRLIKPVSEIWTDVKQILVKKMKEPTFQSWINPTQLLELNGNEAVIGVNNDFTKGVIITHHMKAVVSALSQVTKMDVSIRIVVDSSIKAETYTPTIGMITVLPAEKSVTAAEMIPQPAQQTAALGNLLQARSRADLNSRYTFDSFVVGSHNRFCHSAAMAVAQHPGQAYNPLFIYGGVGLGKTHIMQAIGHEILRHSPKTNIRYMSCERFTNELINSIRDDRMMDFRKRYRQVDVLLMDDIQFIQGKESTQEEFFHTFNALKENNRQIVLSSDRPPKAISLLEERLRSRFEWGLIADIQVPDLETRMAILHKKCEIDGMRVADEVLEYIASVFVTNIRELEGALIRAHAYASLTGSPLTLESLRGILMPVQPNQKQVTLTMEIIIDTVAKHYHVEPSEIRSQKRSQDLALPRHIAMYLAHEMMQMSFPRIGQAFSNRKHTSALYAYARIKEAIPDNADLSKSIKQIKHQLCN